MCSWCWGFSEAFRQLREHLPVSILVKRVLGGLAPDTDQPMPAELKQQIIAGWQRIEAMIPGVKFNFDFWKKCQPRRSTYASCRAVIAARQQGEQYDVLMTRAIQKAYYQQARNPSEDETLIELAIELGLSRQRFIDDFYSHEVKTMLQQEIDLSRHLFVESYPSLVLQVNDSISVIEIDYTDYQTMLKQIREKLHAIY